MRNSQLNNIMKPIKLLACLAAISMVAGQAWSAEVFIQGGVKHERWDNKVVNDIVTGNVGVPDLKGILPALEEADGQAYTTGNNFADRTTGFFMPPVTGFYDFYVASDDDSNGWISTDETAANKRMVCQETGWNNYRAWITTQSGIASQKSSATWTNATSGDLPVYPDGIQLTAGNRYYIEYTHHDGTGGGAYGMTFSVRGDANYPTPVDGDASKLTGDLIGYSITAATALTFTTPPVDTTNYVDTTVVLSVVVSSDGEVAPTYQWRRGGVPITGAVSPKYSFVATMADDQATFDVIASDPGGVTVTSPSAKVTVKPGSVTVNGYLKREFFPGGTRTNMYVGNGAPNQPTLAATIDYPEQPGDNWSERFSGYFTPTVGGNYVFFVQSDDDADLWLSTDATRDAKRLIAQETNWGGYRLWATGGDLAQKRSDTWTNDVGTAPYSAGIPLVAGTKYYIEADHHEGGGGNNFSLSYKLLADAEPLDGDASRITSAMLSFQTAPATTSTITTQPHNITVNQGSDTNFSVAITSDSEFVPLYQWRRNGVNISGANSSTLPIVSANMADDLAVYSCVITFPGFSSLNKTSANATLDVQTAYFATGFLKYEAWLNKSRADINNGNYTTADQMAGFPKAVTSFHGDVDSHPDGSASKISGFFIPATTDNYYFWLHADDDADLYLSTNDQPSTKRLIAQETNWSNDRDWTGGDGTAIQLAQKASVTWTNGAGISPYAAGIALTAGTKYYIEAVQHDGSGGDNLGVTAIAELVGTTPIAGDLTTLTGARIGFYAVGATITITNQPVSVATLVNRTATFTVVAGSDTVYPPLAYQWTRNNVDIAGANGSSYTTPLLTLADNGAQFRCVLKAVGSPDVTTAPAATLTVSADSTPPTVVGAGTLTDFVNVGVVFDELIAEATAVQTGNYTVSGGTVSGVVTNYDGKSVTLTVAGLSVGTPFTVTVQGVRDLANNIMASQTVDGYSDTSYINQDVGTPLQAGSATSIAEGQFSLTAGGDDIWNAADQFHFVAKALTGDFDKMVRVDNLEPVNRWSKAGLMVRESLDANSRFIDVVAQPLAIPVVYPSGTDLLGQNQFDFQGRDTTAAGAVGHSSSTPTVAFPGYVRLKKAGLTVTGHISYDGTNWTQIGSAILATEYANYYVGPCLTAHNNTAGVIVEATFSGYRDVPVSTPPVFNAPTLSGGNMTISWTGPGTLKEATSLTAPITWTPSASQANPQTVPAGSGAKFYQITNP